jgi:NADPH2:quinone reductase
MKNHHIVVPRRGGPDVMQVVEEDLPEPKADEVRVQVLAAGVSAYDLMLRSSSFPGFTKVPYTPGVDIVGVVDAVGDGVVSLAPGQMVAAGPWDHGGGYTEFVCVPAAELVPVPPGLDPAEAVCLVANYLTAYLAMHRVADVQGGDRVLIQGAAGGVGTALLELGKLAGLEMYGTASPHNHELVSAMGAVPIDYRTEDVVARIRSLTGHGVDAVFDPIGGARQLRRSHRALAKGGRLVWFGMTAALKGGVRVIPQTLLMVGLLKLLPDGRKVVTTPKIDAEWNRATLAELLGLLAVGKLKPVVAERIPLLEAVRAHELLGRGGHAGKVVLIAGE